MHEFDWQQIRDWACHPMTIAVVGALIITADYVTYIKPAIDGLRKGAGHVAADH